MNATATPFLSATIADIETQKKDRCTLFVLVSEVPLDNFTGQDWQPWINCKPQDAEVYSLAAHKFLRERGGLLKGEFLRLFIYVRNTLSLPCCVRWSEVKLSEDKSHER